MLPLPLGEGLVEGGHGAKYANPHLVDVPTRGGYIARPTATPAIVAEYLSAQVAELVDAQVSGTCGRKVVEVRVFSWAPTQ